MSNIIYNVVGKRWNMSSVTLKDIAQKAGLSIATVSHALNSYPDIKEETRARVIRVAEELNYHPNLIARGLVKRQTNTLGLMIPREVEYAFSDPYFPEVIRGIDNIIVMHGFSLNISTADTEAEEELAYTRMLRSKRVDGIFLFCPRIYDRSILRLEREGISFVAIGRYLGEGKTKYYVDSDSVDGVFKGVEHLIKLGHTRIGFIGGPRKLVVSHNRLTGYKQALKRHRIKYEEELVVGGDYGQESGYKAMQKLFDRGRRPTAVFAANDLMAVGAMRATKERGFRIPQDMAIVGFDDKEFASWLEPPLTTVRQSVFEIGAQAARMLVRLVNKENIEQTEVLLPTELIVRGSCGGSLAQQV